MKTTDDLKIMLAQWRTQFPNLYLRAVRGDCSVTVLTTANPLTQADVDYIEENYMPLPEVQLDEAVKSKKEHKPRKPAKRKTDPSNFTM